MSGIWQEGDDCSVLYPKGVVRTGEVIGQSLGGYMILFDNPSGADEVDPAVPQNRMFKPEELAERLEARL